MKHPIGFNISTGEAAPNEQEYASPVRSDKPVKSVVRVAFPDRHMTLSYYNDAFDLRRGDIVYVEGKLEGMRGYVVEVSHSFKIKLSDYKRVISVADTDVHGRFVQAGSHFVTFDRQVLPPEKVITWFRAPLKEDDEFVSGSDGTSFLLSDLKGMKISPEIAERGHDYYTDNKVRYLSLDGRKGYAIVEGSHPYEVEFNFHTGEISNLVCNCFCYYPCKHEFAAMLQLRETLELLEKNYSAEYEQNGYFAALHKGTLFSLVIDGRESGEIVL